ncbi:polyprenyl diphosphate synthase [Campylobacter ureolyticus]|uniref:Isoprenyl transferase n=1 Tax=Campylobacter ureolyticus TaxID=827 RepID=A0AAE7E9Y2_9BACT|nr:polyprenyl diphosphate synthase [Campylobacter ureolyticus]MCR8684272.1 polyprenyl diphosphate synthase [Campylobacter ureolyticus]MDU5325625.1 polyprenyl diphosphate synthase [Campylobacter ureolyticus]QKF84305.1 undecaprenyl diphosphate synthetase [Campylobacter ureolyticus]QQY35540.1 di-trans,poly-cis-decaprenylcistransferase [Campylobacter ureolyticus]SUX23313.1 undecaprenyl diphosphate synthase [Campylobacter ureolyticus]
MNKLNHLAIIMDGNGRWAKKRGFIRTKGHDSGANVVENVAKFCIDKDIKNLTLYAFSTENWARPKSEVEYLIKLFKEFLIKKEEIFIKNEIKFETIGNLSKFDDELLNLIANIKEKTAIFNKLTLTLAVNYGSKDEIVRAVKKLISKGNEINEATISQNLDTAKIGDVDLLIRTGGEQRLSNFLLWQASYAELFFTPTLWPDFSYNELEKIVEKYTKIHRKFGGL